MLPILLIITKVYFVFDFSKVVPLSDDKQFKKCQNQLINFVIAEEERNNYSYQNFYLANNCATDISSSGKATGLINPADSLS